MLVRSIEYDTSGNYDYNNTFDIISNDIIASDIISHLVMVIHQLGTK